MYDMCSWGWSDDNKRRSLGQDSARFVVATAAPEQQGQHGQVVGFVHYRFELEQNVETLLLEAFLYVHELQVVQEAQGSGLGTRLMRIMEAFAAHHKMDKVMLTVFVYNPAFKFYTKSLGYREELGSKYNRVLRNETLELSKLVGSAENSDDQGDGDVRTAVMMMIKGTGQAQGQSEDADGIERGECWGGAGGGGGGGAHGEEGSVFGAALIFAGTAVGAGMIALPAETAPSGFIPSEASLLTCWAFTYVTSLLTLEAAWLLGGDQGDPRGFLSMAKNSLGGLGEAVVGLLFWYLLTSICVAYTAEGGQLIAQAAAALGLPYATPTVGSLIFVSAFAALAVGDTGKVDLLNRALMLGLVASFLALEMAGLPLVNVALLSRADWSMVYPQCISIGVISFGAQNVVPTILAYLGGDPKRTKEAIAAGSLIPLAMYSAWNAVFLGIAPFVPGGAALSKDAVVAAMSQATGASAVASLLSVFTVCAICSSMAGACASFVDFFVDSAATLLARAPSHTEASLSTRTDQRVDQRSVDVGLTPRGGEQRRSLAWPAGIKGRAAATAMALLPALFFAVSLLPPRLTAKRLTPKKFSSLP